MCNIQSFHLNYDQPSSLQFLHQHFFSTSFPIGQTGFSGSVADVLSAPPPSPAFANFAVLAKFPKKSSKFSLFFQDRSLRFKSCLPSIISFKIKKTLLLSQQGFISGRQDFPVLSQTSCLLRHRRLRSLTLPSWQSFPKKAPSFRFFWDRLLRFKSCLP